jgi:hypothetical protein
MMSLQEAIRAGLEAALLHHERAYGVVGILRVPLLS